MGGDSSFHTGATEHRAFVTILTDIQWRQSGLETGRGGSPNVQGPFRQRSGKKLADKGTTRSDRRRQVRALPVQSHKRTRRRKRLHLCSAGVLLHSELLGSVPPTWNDDKVLTKFAVEKHPADNGQGYAVRFKFAFQYCGEGDPWWTKYPGFPRETFALLCPHFPR